MYSTEGAVGIGVGEDGGVESAGSREGEENWPLTAQGQEELELVLARFDRKRAGDSGYWRTAFGGQFENCDITWLLFA